MSSIVCYVDEAGPREPESPEASIFLAAAVLSVEEEPFFRFESSLRELFESGSLRKTKGRRASQEELDAFTDCFLQSGLVPAVTYARLHDKGFRAAYEAKVAALNREGAKVLHRTGVNRDFFPEDGIKPGVKIWLDVTLFCVSTGLAYLAGEGTRIDSLSVHLDRMNFKTEVRNLQLEILRSHLSQGVRTVVRPILEKSGRPVTHIPDVDFPVTADNKGAALGQYAADYLCSIAYRHLNAFDLKKHYSKPFHRLQERFPAWLFIDTTTVLKSTRALQMTKK